MSNVEAVEPILPDENIEAFVEQDKTEDCVEEQEKQHIQEHEHEQEEKQTILSNIVGELDRRDALLRQKAGESSLAISRIMSGDSAGMAESTGDASPLMSEFVVERRAIYEKLVAEYPTKIGKAVSKRERDELGKAQSTLVYGEINFDSFAIAFDKIKNIYGVPGQGTTPEEGIMQRAGGKFYDLGSGTGKPAIVAACLHPFDFVGGVELLEGLFKYEKQLVCHILLYVHQI